MRHVPHAAVARARKSSKVFPPTPIHRSSVKLALETQLTNVEPHLTNRVSKLATPTEPQLTVTPLRHVLPGGAVALPTQHTMQPDREERQCR